VILPKTLWRRNWLESRTRFIGALAVTLLVISWDILDAEHGMSRFDSTPRITFTQYVAYLFRGHLQWVWIARFFCSDSEDCFAKRGSGPLSSL
jgi:hypothetical protein